jgi:hypothetical protein
VRKRRKRRSEREREREREREVLMKHPRKGRRFGRGGSARERWRATSETKKKVIMAAAGAAGMG